MIVMDTAKVLLLGDSRLRRVSEPVLDICHSDYLANKLRLQRTLEDFRMRHGFGRAISAPQIGVPRRFIALHLDRAFVMVNPEITWRSESCASSQGRNWPYYRHPFPLPDT